MDKTQLPERKKARLLFLTQYFPPETGAPQARISEIAHHLSKVGYSVSVVTALPNYPTGRVYAGYRYRLWMTEMIDGMQIVRTVIFPTKRATTIPRLTCYFSFVLSSMAIGSWLIKRPDIIIVESPPLFLGISGMLLKWVFDAALVFNVSDLWPETPIRMGLNRNSLAAKLAAALELRCYQAADLVTGQSKGIVEGVKNRYPQAQVEEIPNGCDCEFFKPQPPDESLRKSLGLAGKIIIGYAGLMGIAQGISLILKLAKNLSHRDDIVFLLVGDGPESGLLQEKMRQDKLSNVVFLGSQPKERMPALVSTMDITVIPLRFHIPGALPSKLYESMACCIPVVFAGDGDGARLIAAANSGHVVQYEDLEALTDTVLRLIDDPACRRKLGMAGRSYVTTYHDRSLIAKRFENLLAMLTSRNKPH